MAQHVHVEAHRLGHHALADAAHPDHAERATGHLVAEPRQVRMPGRPLPLAQLELGRVEPPRDGADHEEGVLRGRVGQHVRRVRVGDPVAVGGGAVDVVHADRHLGDDLEPRGGARREDLLVDRVPQRRDERLNARAHPLEHERLRRRLRLGVDLDREALLAQPIERGLADVARGVDPSWRRHGRFRPSRTE
jgi:hypothetical protein